MRDHPADVPRLRKWLAEHVWHLRFAWRPVTLTGSETRVWLKPVERRRYTDQEGLTRWEYRLPRYRIDRRFIKRRLKKAALNTKIVAYIQAKRRRYWQR